jgi:hypothetical protein
VDHRGFCAAMSSRVWRIRDVFEDYDGRTILATQQHRCSIAVTFLQAPSIPVKRDRIAASGT